MLKKRYVIPWRWLFLSVGLMLFDKVTKHWAVSYLPLRETITLLPGIGLHLCYNPGIGFSLLTNRSTLLIFLTSAILLSTLKELYQSHTKNDSSLVSIGFSLILAGGLGNLYDRLTTGAVIDFITIYLLGWKTPIFNVADIFISLGVLVIIMPEFLLWLKSQRVP